MNALAITILSLALPATEPAGGETHAVSAATRDAHGFLVHEVRSPYQAGITLIRVLLPDKLEPGKAYAVVYVLPVEAGSENRYGDGLLEIKQKGLHNKHQAIFVAPTFSHLPWYADHPTKAAIRQESYFLKVVVPFIEKTYPVQRNASGRLLLGFSKSGWGAFSLLLRHPDRFGKAAAWDAPMIMARPDRFGMGEIFGTQENFANYQITQLIEARSRALQAEPRLILLGYGNFRDHHEKAHALMTAMRIAHVYRDGPKRQHDWHSGWVTEAVAALVPAQDVPWKAGLAKALITPQTGVWLAGYGTKRPPDGKLHELWMKAVALEDAAGNRAVLVTSDFQGVPKEMSDRVFAELERKHKLARRQVMFTFSHNHCGPRLGNDLVDYYPVEADQVRLVEEYTTLMETRLVELVGEALAKLAPAHLAWGEGRTTFAVNRRNNREADVPAILARGEALKGPVDHAVPVLTVTRPDGTLIGILFGYACHPTTLSFTKWCGDYPGFAQIALEQAHPGALAMFVNTCGGDQNPLPRRKVELCERYGRMLADAVEEMLKQPRKHVAPELRTAFAYVDLPYEKIITRAELVDLRNDTNPVRKRWAERMLGKLDAGERFASAYPYPLHAWRLGELRLIGLGAEAVVDYSLRFKAKYGPGAWVFGYVDDMIAYIPSRRVWAEGGYEGGPNLFEYGRPALRWSGDVEERIAAKVHDLVQAVSP